MRPVLRITAAVFLSLLLHLLLGWEWTIFAGVAAGLWFAKSGWMIGGAAVGAEWLLVVVYDYLVDARAIGVMTETLGGIMGNLPGWAVVGFTLLIGLVLGVLGGAIGSQIRKLVHRERHQALSLRS
ncbi:MAG: hypothetical protein WD275_09675 [Rhodothermales bacterium]